MTPRLIVIGGPTASGKSDLALRLAEALGGVIVNADSMQLYRDLRLLTARPGPKAESRAPHYLYGILGAEEVGSAGRWLEWLGPVLKQAAAERRPAIVVGGTGLYLKALLEGLAPVPDIPCAARREARALHQRLGGGAFRIALERLDPEAARQLQAGDRQRLIRAYEVAVATGRPLAAWQQAPRLRITLPQPWLGVAVLPPRPALRARIRARLEHMVAEGALAEVEALLAQRLDPALPVMKAVGLRPLAEHVAGRASLETALELAAIATCQFAKRQVTWLRHQLTALEPVAGFADELGLDTVLRCGERRGAVDHPQGHA